jgi:hypothetical protein
MRLNIVIVFVAAAFTLNGYAQENKAPAKDRRLIFHSFNMLNLLYNSQGLNAGLQSVNGFQYQKTFAGIGAALDWYGLQSVPIFFDLRQEFKVGRARFFGYGNIGYNIAWTGNDIGHSGISSEYKNDGGIYYDFGLGYLIPFNRRNAMVLSGGYSVKEMREWYGFSPCGRPGQCPTVQYEKFNYRFQRLSVKIGWRF